MIWRPFKLFLEKPGKRRAGGLGPVSPDPAMPGRTGSSAGGLDEPWIKTIQAFRPEAGDRFVITTKDRLSEAQITRIRDQFADFLPDGCKVAVLTDGLQLELIDAALFPLLMGACFG